MLKSLFRRRPPNESVPAIGEAEALVKLGRHEEAESLVAALLAADPADPRALRLLGTIKLHRGQTHEALGLLGEALRIDPQSADGLACLGLAQLAQRRSPEALTTLDRAVLLDPRHAAAHASRASALLTLGRTPEALASYQQSLALDPGQHAVRVTYGEVLLAIGKQEEALDTLEEAIASDPENSRAHAARGRVLAILGRHADAVFAFDRAIEIDPFLVDAFINRGNVQHALGREDEALMDYDTALQFAPESADAWYNQGVVLGSLRRLADAVASYDRAIALEPDRVDAHFNRGIAAGKLNDAQSALASFDAVLARDPDYPYVLGQAAFTRAELCSFDGYDALAARAQEGVRQGKLVSDPFVLLAFSDQPAAQLACATMRIARGVTVTEPMVAAAPSAHGKIRLAYLSANFCAHAVAYLIIELIERHDRDRFELTAISFGPDDGSAMLARARQAFDKFIDVRGMRDAEVASLIRGAGIDIAIDLMGFTRDSRIEILASRPAPIQVNFLGYPGTMGAPFIDYIVADPFLIPPSERANYSERVVYLPDTYQPNDRKRRIDERTPTRAEAGLPETGFVFCCFNNNYKITPAVFDVWMRLLQSVPGSVLWLLPISHVVSANLAREAQARGVAPERLIYAPRVDLAAHLARHRLADLFLDTMPYNAHTTASDALWAGLPIVTYAGRSFAARVAGSLLHAVGLPELVTESLAEYEALALRIARDPAYLASLKARLAANRDSAPLFDSDRYRRHLEAAYEVMMDRHRNHLAPADIVVAPIG